MNNSFKKSIIKSVSTDCAIFGFENSSIKVLLYRRAQNPSKASVLNKPVGFELLPEKFTFPQLQKLYEVILGKNYDRRNFRKKIMRMNILTKLNEKNRNTKKRPADLYKFNKSNYQKLVNHGMLFGI